MSKFFSLTILPKKIMDKMGGGRECHIFPSINFCVTVLKDFVGKPSVLQRISASENKLMHKGGITILPKKLMEKMGRGRECHNFPSKNC